MPTTRSKKSVISLEPLENQEMTVKLIGESPLVMHRWGKKATEMIQESQSGKPKSKKKPPRDPDAEIEDAICYDEDGDVCIPTIWIKQAIVNAGQRYYDGVTRPFLRGVIYLPGESVKLQFDKMEPHTGHVRLANGSSDLRYRPMFHDWSLVVTIEFDASRLRAEMLLEFIRRAGFSVGLCEWRIEKGGQWGKFRIAEEGE